MTDFNTDLGLRLDGDELVLDTRPEHQVAPGLIHFAVLATLAEVSAARAVGGGVVPTSLTLNLLRRAEPGRLVARGSLVKRGRTLSVAEGEVSQNGRLVAKAVVQFAMT